MCRCGCHLMQRLCKGKKNTCRILFTLLLVLNFLQAVALLLSCCCCVKQVRPGLQTPRAMMRPGFWHRSGAKTHKHTHTSSLFCVLGWRVCCLMSLSFQILKLFLNVSPPQSEILYSRSHLATPSSCFYEIKNATLRKKIAASLDVLLEWVFWGVFPVTVARSFPFYLRISCIGSVMARGKIFSLCKQTERHWEQQSWPLIKLFFNLK